MAKLVENIVRRAARHVNLRCTGPHMLSPYAAFRTMPSISVWSLIPSL
jgi:hypothetical protein